VKALMHTFLGKVKEQLYTDAVLKCDLMTHLEEINEYVMF